MSKLLPAALRRFLDAINRNDTPAFLAHFASDGVVDDWGTRYIGQERIRNWSDREFIGVQVNLVVASISQQGSEFSVLAEVGGHGYTGPSRFVLYFAGEQVQEMRITAR